MGTKRSTPTIVCTFLIVSLIAAGLLTSCRKEPQKPKDMTRPVKLVTLETPGIYKELAYPAQVEAFQEADLSFLVPGRLIEIAVKRGESVEAGQVLARLDPKDYENRFRAAEAAAGERATYMRRIQLALEKGAATDMELDEAERQYEVAKANMEIEAKALADTVLYAPFVGEIGRQYKENYQDLAAKEKIFRLQDVSQLKVVVDLPEAIRIMARESASRREENGQETTPTFVTFEDLPGQKFPVEYYEDEKTADPLTKTYAVTFVMPSPGRGLLPGMSATLEGKINIKTPKGTPAFYLPVTAVLSGADTRRYVWVQDAETQRVKKREVKVGAMSGDDIQVLEGLDIGETVAVSGAHYLRDGMKVTPLVFKARREEE